MSKIGWQGKFIIQIKDKARGKVTEEVINNRVMNAVLNQLSDTLLGDAPDLEIKYLALGTSNTPVSDGQIQLGAEIFRTQAVNGPVRTQTGQIETEFTVLDTEAVGTIEEIGIFVGSSATASANSGTLLSRILWHKEKTNSEEITFKRIDRMVRA
jgi:hypothetical protein